MILFWAICQLALVSQIVWLAFEYRRNTGIILVLLQAVVIAIALCFEAVRR